MANMTEGSAAEEKTESPAFEKKEDAGKSKAKLGSGARFAALKAALDKKKGVTDPGALAASIGRKKYGSAKFNALAAAGRKNKK